MWNSGSELLKARVYGARGSLPNCIGDTRRYGGGTTSLAVRVPAAPPLIIDAGTGIIDLGNELAAAYPGGGEVHIFFTHTHWDHVQGFPFFYPSYLKDWTIHIYALDKGVGELKEIFSKMYQFRYFPVPFEVLPSRIQFHKIRSGDEIRAGEALVRACRVNHPGLALGYRIESPGGTLFFASDAAPFRDFLFEDKYATREEQRFGQEREALQPYEDELFSQIEGASLLFHDANYTADEYQRFITYGHSSMDYALEVASRCGVHELVLWHHDRSRTDGELDAVTGPIIKRGAELGITVSPARAMETYTVRG